MNSRLLVHAKDWLFTVISKDLDVFVDNKRIKTVSSLESLHLTIDENLIWSKHIDVSKKVSSAIKVYQGISFGMAWVANYTRRYKNYRIRLPVPSRVLLMIFNRLLL